MANPRPEHKCAVLLGRRKKLRRVSFAFGFGNVLR
jgi:hypothetical protein